MLTLRRRRTPLTAEGYVWQSPDRQEVGQAIANSLGAVSKLNVREAELKWTGVRFETLRALTKLPAPDYVLADEGGGSKRDKAEKLGVTILDEAALKNLIEA